MLNPNAPDEQPDHHSQPHDLRLPQRPSPSEPPSIRRLCDRILERGNSPIRDALQEARSAAPLTGEMFTSLARSFSDLPSLKQLSGALESMLHEGIDSHFAECMPALAHTTKSLLMFDGEKPERAKMASHRLNSLVLAVMNVRDEFCSALISGLDEAAASDLAHAVNEGNPAETAYWSCLELQTVSRPTMENLKRMFDAHACVRDLLPERSVPSQALRRVVRALGEREFGPVFGLVLAEQRSCAEKQVRPRHDTDMLRYAVSGLAYAALPHMDEFITILSNAEDEEFRLATRVAIDIAKGLEHDPDDEVIIALREATLEIIDSLPEGASGAPNLRATLAHTALASLAAAPDDVALVQSYADRALEGEPSEALVELLEELAEAYEGVFDTEGLAPLQPVPPNPKFGNASPVLEERCAQSSRHVNSLSGVALNAYLASMAVSLLDFATPRELKPAAADIAATVRASALTSRSPDEGTVFAKLSEARAFAKRFHYLCLSGLTTAAAALLPEALSILRSSEDQDLKRKEAVANTYKILCNGLVDLAFLILEQEPLRSLAAARLSARDWALLRSLHDSDEHELGSAAESAALASLSLRAALEPDDSWHEDLIRTVSQENVDESLFVVPCFIGERRRPNSSWDLISKVYLRRDDDMVMLPCAAGASLGLADGYQNLFSLLSGDADEIAKGLLLLQALRFDLTEEQLAECQQLVLPVLDWPGQIGVDALVTYGCIADEAGCAREMNKLSKPAGTETAYFCATRALAVAQALRNVVVPRSEREHEERELSWEHPDG